MRINASFPSLLAYNALAWMNQQAAKPLARLSTGLRINGAADDAAGLAISEKMTAQIRGLDQAARNAQDGVSMLEVAEGAMSEIHSMIQRMREISVLAANDTLTAEDRSYIQLEIDELTRQINDIANQTQFNKKKILNGDSAVLWSTSTSDIRVAVFGNLISKDIFGQKVSAAGNYKITFSTIAAGTENVQKSNIMYLKHGTHEAFAEYSDLSGLANMSAVNMVEGVYRIETRDNPFGGISYWNGSTQYTDDVLGAQEVGGELSANSTPQDKMATGTYDVRLSASVPMMADFEDALDAGIVSDVNISSRGASSDFDAEFDIVTGAGGVAVSDSAVYRTDIGNEEGGSVGIGSGPIGSNDVVIGTNADNGLNVFTHYAVTGTDHRDIVNSALEVYAEVAVPSTGAEMYVQLDYQTADSTNLNAAISYAAGVDGLSIISTYYFKAGDAITITGDGVLSLTYTLTAAKSAMDVISDLSLLADGNPSTNPTNCTASYNGSTGDLAIVSGGLPYPHTITLGLTNNTSENLTISGAIADIFGAAGTVGVLPSDNDILGTYFLDNDRTIILGDSSITLPSYPTGTLVGEDLSSIAAMINSRLNQGSPTSSNPEYQQRGIIATVQDSGTDHAKLVFTQAADSSYSISISSASSYNAPSNSVANELGLNGLSFTHHAGGSYTGTVGVFDNYNLTSVDTSLKSLTDLETILETLTGPNGTLASGIDAVISAPASGLSGVTVNNGSMYNITLSGAAITELYGSNLSVARGASSGPSNAVYNGHNVGVVLPGGTGISGIEGYLSAAVITALADAAGEGLSSNNGVDLFEYDSVSQKVRVNNQNQSGYKITVGDTTGSMASTLWPDANDRTVNRGSTGGYSVSAGTGGSALITIDINDVAADDLVDHINNEIAAALVGEPSLAYLADLKAEWVIEPDSSGENRAQIKLVNSTNRSITIKELGSDSGDGINSTSRTVFASPEFSINTLSASPNSRILQAHDKVTLRVTWEGNRADNAAAIGGSADVELWEGDATNYVKLNSVTGGLGGNFFTNFLLKDNVTSTADILSGLSDFKVNDSWIIYTKAKSTTASSDNITLSLYDGKYATTANNGGVTASIVYVFNDNVLDGKDLQLHEMIRTGRGVGATESLVHNIGFFDTLNDVTTSFQYGERAGAGDIYTWGMGSGVNAWYSQVYYGNDTTYFFANGSGPDDVLQNISVYKQNDVNATIMFEWDGASLTYKLKGYDRSSADPLDYIELNGTFDFGTKTIGSIVFTDFDIDTALLTAGDKFVVNVAAAAKLDALNATPSSGDFDLNSNISIDGDPFRQGRPDEWNTRMQYRFMNGKVDGQNALQLLGFAIDPMLGSNNNANVGYYGGTLELDVTQSVYPGFNPDSGVGEPGQPGVESNAYWIRADVNNQGETEPIASGLVTSVYFQRMESSGGSLNVDDFIGAIGYSDYQYGVRADGTYGPMNEPGDELYNPYNGSLIFDVLEVEESVVTFRIQGHIIDLDGNQWYAEEEEFKMNLGANTGKNSVAVPPLLPDMDNLPFGFGGLSIFRDSPFGGLQFDEFTLAGSASIWSEGDRFTLSLVASGGEDPDIDEITVFSDQRGTNMPHAFRFHDGVLDNSVTDLHIYQLANNLYKPDSDNFAKDQVMDGTLSLVFGEYNPDAASTVDDAVTFTIVYQRGMDAGVAHYYSRLEDMKQFYDGSGRFILEGGGEFLTIRQGGREIVIALGGGMELGKLALMMSERIWLELLHQYDGVNRGEDDKVSVDYKPGMMREEDMDEIIQFVNFVPGPSENEAVPGTLLAHSVLPGADSKLKFYGSEDIMKAFAFTDIQEAADTMFSVNVSDAHSGKLIESGIKAAAGVRLHNIISDGIALDIDSDIGLLHSFYNEKTGTFDSDIEKQISQYVHLADNAAALHIGANEGENMLLTLGALTADALDINDLDVRTREEASRSITRLDNAIRHVSAQRAIVGAQISRLGSTISNLGTASLNLTNSRSRIADADIAKEMMEFTKLNIISKAANSMLAQANQINTGVLTLLG